MHPQNPLKSDVCPVRMCLPVCRELKRYGFEDMVPPLANASGNRRTSKPATNKASEAPSTLQTTRLSLIRRDKRGCNRNSPGLATNTLFSKKTSLLRPIFLKPIASGITCRTVSRCECLHVCTYFLTPYKSPDILFRSSLTGLLPQHISL